MARRRPGAAIVLADPLFVREAANLVRLAAEHRLPVMYALREVVVAGGLISYGASFRDLFRRAATYVDKIATLGLTIPQALLVRADEVIR